MSKQVLTQARLAQAVYNSHNRSDTAVIDGWAPVWVNTAGLNLSPTFGAQLYEREGAYTLAFRGTQANLSDWAQNIRYGAFAWSDEFADTVKFAVRSMQQIAEQTQSTLALVSDRFQTTGHSQGGFEAELASTLLGIPGVSFDGMGAAGVTQQFKQLFDSMLEDMNASQLAQHTPLSTSDFLTRIYSVVGRLGLHTGTVENAWSWKLTQGMTMLHPMTGLLTGASMVVAHSISDIVDNEALRMRSRVWQWLGQSGVGVDDEVQWIADQTIRDLQSVNVASNDNEIPEIADLGAMHASLLNFLQSHSDQALSIEQEGQAWWITSESSGDAWRGFEDGSWLMLTTTAGEQIYEHRLAEGVLVQRITQSVDSEGSMVLTEVGTNGTSSATLKGDQWILHLHESNGHAEEQTWQVTDDSWVLAQRVVTSYSADELNAAQAQAWMSALGLIQNLRQGNEWGSLMHVVQLSDQVQILAQQPTLWSQNSAVLIGALDVIQSIQQWDHAYPLQRMGIVAQVALSSDQVLRHLHPQQQGGFIESPLGAAALQTVAAWTQLASALQTGNPLLLGQSFVAMQQSGSAMGWFADDFTLDPTTLVAMELVQLILGDWLQHPPESAAAPPWAHMHVNEAGAWSSIENHTEGLDGVLGLNMLEPLLLQWTDRLQQQSHALNLHWIPHRLPEVRLEGFPSFDRHGVDNYWISIAFTHQVTGQTMGLAVHAADAEEAFVHAALSAGVWVTEFEAATLEMKKQHGAVDPYVTWGEWRAQQGIDSLKQISVVDQRHQIYQLLAIDLGADGWSKRSRDLTATLSVSAVLADTELGVARADVDHDGFLERTDWIEPRDALLAIDLNADGWLIGSDEWLINQPVASLSYWDANLDGWLTRADPIFEQLHLWIDLHADARHSPGEAWSFTALDIQGLHLDSSALHFDWDDTSTIVPLTLEAEVEGIYLEAEHDAQGNTVAGQFTWVLEGQEPLLAITQSASSIPGISLWAYGENQAPAVNALTQYTVPEDGIWSNNQNPNLRRRMWMPDFLNQVQARDSEGSTLAFGDFTQLNGIERVERIDNGVMITLAANSSGLAGFDYRVTDGQGGWTTGRVELDVIAQNDAPWLTGLSGWPSQVARLNGWFDTRIFAFDVDSPATALQTQVSQHAAHGNLTLSGVEWSLWQGSRLSNGLVAGQWDLSYRFRYGDPYTGPVEASIEVTDGSGGVAYSEFQTLHQGSQALRSGKPVAIDWNRDGELTVNSEPSEWVSFDFNQTGSRDLLAWIDSQDAWLAADLNGNQQIDDGSELSFLGLSLSARTDLEGLQSWDLDNDGWLTPTDPMWKVLGVWHDLNHNAVTEAGEWSLLTDLGWQSIELNSDHAMNVSGDAHIFGSAVAKDDQGMSVALWDVALPMYEPEQSVNMPAPSNTHDWVQYWSEQARLISETTQTTDLFWQQALDAASALGETLEPTIDDSQVWLLT